MRYKGFEIVRQPQYSAIDRYLAADIVNKLRTYHSPRETYAGDLETAFDHTKMAVQRARRVMRSAKSELILKHKALRSPLNCSKAFGFRLESDARQIQQAVKYATERVREVRKARQPLKAPKPGRILEIAKSRKADRIFSGKGPESNARHYAVEIECITNCRPKELALLMADEGFSKHVSIKHDGSLRTDNDHYCDDWETYDGTYGVEIVLCAPSEDFATHLAALTAFMNKPESKCWVNRSCGLHVHFDFRGQRDAAYKAYKNLCKSLGLLSAMVPGSRRNNQYCRLNTSADKFGAHQRYRFINSRSYSRYETIEVRGHTGTTDYNKIMQWIRVCSAIAYGAPILRVRNGVEGLLDRLAIPEHTKRYVRERILLFTPRPLHRSELSEQ